MYSLILMSAMTAAPDTADFHGFFRNLFRGCRGGCDGGCYGSGAARPGGCTGTCDGFGSRLRAFFDRGGSCYGSCTGRSLSCFGSCTGRSYSCLGSAYAGCYGSAVPTGVTFAPPAGSPSFADPACCDGPVGDPYPGRPVAPPATAGPGVFDGVPPATPAPARPEGPPMAIPDSPPSSSRRVVGLPTGGAGARGTVVVRLPADARLYAEGRLLTLTSAERTFVTPVLPAGEYTYVFRAEYTRDGETITRSKRVGVRTGGTATVEFADLADAGVAARPAPMPLAGALPTGRPTPVEADPASRAPAPAAATPAAAGGPPAWLDRARITVTLPPGATLYVDGRRHESSATRREFTTPPLPPGRDFEYQMKVVADRDGRPATTTTAVRVRAGEIAPVDFTKLAGPGG